MQPSSFVWNPVALRRLGQVTRGREVLGAERVGRVEDERQQLIPDLDVTLAHPRGDAAVGHLIIGIGSISAPTPATETVPPRRTALRHVGGRRAVDRHPVDERLGQRVGRCPTAVCAAFAAGEPCASIPTASTTLSGPRPSVISMRAAATSSTALTSSVSTPCSAARARRSATRSTPMTRSAPRCRPMPASCPTDPGPGRQACHPA